MLPLDHGPGSKVPFLSNAAKIGYICYILGQNPKEIHRRVPRLRPPALVSKTPRLINMGNFGKKMANYFF